MEKGINFKYLTIKNNAVFEDELTIPLANQGIVLIQGDNGVGKSSIWDTLEAIVFGSTSNGHKKDDLSKNDDDCFFQVGFEKDKEPITIALKRVKSKWGYDIQKGSNPRTDHNYNDAVRTATMLIGLSKEEFEGSVHLTQGAQHILIKGKLSDRKDYISNFFGIDNRYDQIQLAAKQEEAKYADKINKLSGLSHSQQMLETELKNLEIQDCEPLQNKLIIFQNHFDKLTNELLKVDSDLQVWQEYKKYIDYANRFENPSDLISKVENRIIQNTSNLQRIGEIQSRNEQARKVNANIDKLQDRRRMITNKYPDLVEDDTSVNWYQNELQSLLNLKSQNETVVNLRKELKKLPKVDELPVATIEEQLLKLQIEYQEHAKNKTAKEKGFCTQCGSKFSVQDVQKEIEQLGELKEAIDILTQDYATIKDRNQKAKRRKFIEDHLAKIPEFSKQNECKIKSFQDYIPAKIDFDEIESNLKLLTPMEIAEEPTPDTVARYIEETNKDKQELELLKKCQIAQKLLPIAPSQSEEDLIKAKSNYHNEILATKTNIQNTTHTLGEYKSNNETHKRLQIQLVDIMKKLESLEECKKEEFYWGKMVDAYGPKGLRVQQLEKMMDLLIKQLPVYTSTLYSEKRLSFKHKVDANNVRILACREQVKDDNSIRKFSQDISSFSGGEKDRMSVSFILTLADCIPYHKRSNILVLDEIDATLDEDGKFRFTNDLLPMLRKKYDSIFVISHSPAVQTANVYDQVWRIEKNNHKSTMKCIYPQEVIF